MKKFAAALLFCGVSAFAGNVTYSTSGTFGGADLSGGNLVNGGVTISYTVQAPITVGANPMTNINLGSLVVSDPSNSTGTFSALAGDTFTLTITQTAPVGGSGSSSVSSITGTITGTSSGITVQFSPTTLLIGGDIYTIGALSNGAFQVVAPNTNGAVSGQTTIQGTVTTPEPASLSMIGAGLVGLGLVARRRFAK